MHSRSFLFALAVALMPSLAGAETAKQPAVVELYTSQGCSSCPAADAVFSRLTDRSDVIALSLHVDYWDYLGWKDSFASPGYAKRQRAYARAAGKTMVYTPQMIINGQVMIVGADASAVAAALAPVGGGEVAELVLRRGSGGLTINATSTGPLAAGTFVQLVRYKPTAEVNIKRGENAGRTIRYDNIVTSWKQVGTWDGRKPLEMKVPLSGNEPAVVLIQGPGPGAILAAAVVEN
ncbi:MAG: DUF1223 domain-containing protein [Paracoccaceae bacterium]